MTAGQLRERVTFSLQLESDNSYGGTVGEWEDQFTVAARIKPMRGSEPVIAQRLQGVQPLEITVWSSRNTRLVDTTWRAKNERTGEEFQIRAVTPDERRQYISFVCDKGVAIG